MSAGGRICVVGSVNTDLQVAMERFPVAGETLVASSLVVSGGGKGANQAFALARLGMPVDLVARVGDDAFGRDRLAELEAAGVGTGACGLEAGLASGTAIVETDHGGQNRIVIVAGANAGLGPEAVEGASGLLEAASLALFQLETPLAGVLRGLELSKRAGVLTILDPAPAPAVPLPPELWALVDYLTPNETETAALSGILPADEDGARAAAAELRRRGASSVIVKAGALGAWLFRADGEGLFCPAFPVETIDSTAAGDAFNAGFAAALSGGADEAQALRYACATGALATTRVGAQAAMPGRGEVLSLLLRFPGILARRLGE